LSLATKLLAVIWAADSLAAPNSEEEDLAQVYGSEEMVSIATGAKQPVSKAPAVASVVTAADIKAMGATDIDEVLETVPGLHVARSNIGLYLPWHLLGSQSPGIDADQRHTGH
jgi:iron complex outermembrane receptor protein